MRLVLNKVVSVALGIVLTSTSHAFTQPAFSRGTFLARQHDLSAPSSLTELAAKKKAGKALVSDIDFDAFDDDEPMSKKDLIKAQQAAEKAAKKQQAEAAEVAAPGKKDKNAKALKAIEEMERMERETADQDQNQDADEFGIPKAKMSKKEQKEALKKAEKMAKKQAAKDEKKAAKRAELEAEGDVEDVPDLVGANGDAVDAESEVSINFLLLSRAFFQFLITKHFKNSLQAPKKKRITLEERIRKERPPPRVRVMESAQPNFSSLRLENIGITFRDQEVLKDVTWGVQTGDRIGLVGCNGAGKTTQLRIMYGEMEPTTGDVVKSKKDLRVAMLRQEFIDELVPDRTLLEEFMSVFVVENKILADLREAETQLEQMTGADADEMQEVLDRMQKLQATAESKDVYALESKAKKTMNLMGFEDEEEDYLVAMFSGGWKMRIGLGKVLLQDPNILLLDEPTNHLDLESVEWLEDFLRQQNIPMICVSHDREFLDRVCNKIVDAEGGICTEYDGNYSRFLELKKSKYLDFFATPNLSLKSIVPNRPLSQVVWMLGMQHTTLRRRGLMRIENGLVSSNSSSLQPQNNVLLRWRN